MAARFWRWALAVSIAAGMLVGILLAAALSLPAWTVPAFATVFVAGLPSAFVALTIVIGGGAWRPPRAEVACFVRAIVAIGAQRRRPPPLPAPPPDPRPVLLLHGLLCSHAVWADLLPRLAEAGLGPVDAPDVEPLLADIDVQAQRVAARVRALQQRCAGARVMIVGHSMGGLIARALLRDLGTDAVRAIVTIASPHHGSALARGWPWTAVRQMRPASPWLMALNAAQEGRFPVPVECIWSAADNLVHPADSAGLAGAGGHELDDIGHFGMLRSGRVHDLVVAALSASVPA